MTRPRSRYANAAFWVHAADNALRAGAAAFVACVGTNLVEVTATGWIGALYIGGATSFISVATSIATAPPEEEALPPKHRS